MPSSHASVVTDRPARYGKQLVAHLSRRISGEWDDEAGSGFLDFGNDFADGRGDLRAGAGTLDLDVTGADLARLEDVVGRHLVRFGAREELIVRWTRDDGSAGTEYHNEADT